MLLIISTIMSKLWSCPLCSSFVSITFQIFNFPPMYVTLLSKKSYAGWLLRFSVSILGYFPHILAWSLEYWWKQKLLIHYLSWYLLCFESSGTCIWVNWLHYLEHQVHFCGLYLIRWDISIGPPTYCLLWLCINH